MVWGGRSSVAGAPEAFPFIWWDVSPPPLTVLTYLSVMSQGQGEAQRRDFSLLLCYLNTTLRYMFSQPNQY